jgi:integrase
MMALYGMGAAEVLSLRLEDVDWRAAKIQAYRPKTGVLYTLPLLPAVGQALSAYLREGRPRGATTRHIFVAAIAPHGRMSSSATRYAIRQYAQVAGITTTPLGSHVLRHSHACRQIELGTPVHSVGDILGHRDPASTSHYFRVATERLRSLALPVPAPC